MGGLESQAEEWQSTMLAHLRKATNADQSARPAAANRSAPHHAGVIGSLPTPEPGAGSHGQEGTDSAYRPGLDLTAIAQRPRALHRAASQRPATSRGTRFLGLATSLIGGDSAVTAHTDAVTRLQITVPTGRSVVLSGAHGGAGASTVALLIADAFHTHRPDGVVLIDASAHNGGMLSRLPAAPTMSVAGADKHLNAGDAGVILKPYEHPARVVLSPATDLQTTARVAARLQRRVGVSVIDMGAHRPPRLRGEGLTNREPDPAESAQRQLLSSASAVVVVCDNTVRGLTCVQAAIEDYLSQGVKAASMVAVIVEREADSGITLKQARLEVQKAHNVTVADIGRDRHLAGGAHLHPHLLAARTRYAVARLAAEVIEASARHEH